MVPRHSSKAVAVIVGLWTIAMVAALALATTNDSAVAQQGCGGGGSPSPSGSASASEPPASQLPGQTLLPSLIPVPDQKRDAAPAPLPAPRDVDRDPPAVTAQQDNCPSTVTIAYKPGRTPKFTGKVGSDEPMCKRARDVTIKKVKRGADRTVAKATTNARGNYQAPVRKANGRFYAKVSKATVETDDGQTITCSSARSRTIRP